MRAILLAIVGAVILSGGGLSGHHAHSDFVLDQDTTVTGVIEAIRFQNPHVLIRLRSGSTVYTAEWQGAQWLMSHPELVGPARAPVTSTTLRSGDRIVIVGAPPRESALRTIVNLKEVRRPQDGWTWTCRRPDARMTC